MSIFILLLASHAFLGTGNWIWLDGKKHTNVEIKELDRSYLVQLPGTSEVRVILKSDIHSWQINIEKSPDSHQEKSASVTPRADEIERQPANDAVATSTLSAANFKTQKELFELAEFETQLLQWSMLSEETRAQMAMGIVMSTMARNNVDTERIRRQENRAEELSSYQNDLANEILMKQTSNSQMYRDYIEESADIRDDFSLQWNSGMLEDAAIRYQAQLLYDRPNPYTAISISTYAEKTRRDQQRVNSAAAGVHLVYDAAIRNNNAVMRRLEQSRRELERVKQAALLDRNTAQTLVARREIATSRKLRRYAVLDEHLQAGYTLQVPFDNVLEHSAQGDSQLPDISVSKELWRVEWYVDTPPSNNNTFRLMVKDSLSGKPLKGAMSLKPPSERFILFDKSGIFRIEIQSDPEVKYQVVVSQLAG